MLHAAGQLTRDFKHTRLDFALVEEDGVKKLRVDCHLGKRKSLAVMRTVTSHIQNLFTGVSKVCADAAGASHDPNMSCAWRRCPTCATLLLLFVGKSDCDAAAQAVLPATEGG